MTDWAAKADQTIPEAMSTSDRIEAARVYAQLELADAIRSAAPLLKIPTTQVPVETPVDPQDATGPQKGSGRIGWLRLDPSHRFRHLAREVEGGWADHDDDHDWPGWTATDYPDATFTPLLPFFVAPDGYGEPTIWRETGGLPGVVLVRTPYNADFFDAVAGLLETREEA